MEQGFQMGIVTMTLRVSSNCWHSCFKIFSPGEMLQSGPGSNLGLKVVLDAHTDLVEATTVPTDFEGFTVVITSPGEFPLTYFKGINIKTGDLNY